MKILELNKFFHEKVSFSSLSITANNVYADMGYRKSEPEEPIIALTETLLNEMEHISSPSYAFKLYKGNVIDETVNLYEPETRNPKPETQNILKVGPILSSLLHGSEYFAIFVATAGNSFQSFQDKLKNEDDILKSYVADTIGSCIAEAAGDYMERMLEKEIGSFRHTHRFSPGYCGWYLTGQKEIFRLLGGKPCDISLSDVCLMKPIKSISGVIGIGHEVNEKTYGCSFCELETCYKRRK